MTDYIELLLGGDGEEACAGDEDAPLPCAAGGSLKGEAGVLPHPPRRSRGSLPGGEDPADGGAPLRHGPRGRDSSLNGAPDGPTGLLDGGQAREQNGGPAPGGRRGADFAGTTAVQEGPPHPPWRSRSALPGGEDSADGGKTLRYGPRGRDSSLNGAPGEPLGLLGGGRARGQSGGPALGGRSGADLAGTKGVREGPPHPPRRGRETFPTGEGPGDGGHSPGPGPWRRDGSPMRESRAERESAAELYRKLRRTGAAAAYRGRGPGAALPETNAEQARETALRALDLEFERDARRYDGGF